MMVSKLEKISGVEHSLSIDVPVEKVGEAFKEALLKVGKSATIKGFRKGKAPLSTLRTIYGDKIRMDVLKEMVAKYYVEALNQHQLNPVCQPKIEVQELDPEKPFSFKAQFEVRPEVKLNQVEGLKLKTEVVNVSEDQVNEILKGIQDQHAKLMEITDDRPAVSGDVIVFDFLGTLEGKPVEGASGNGHTLEIGNNRFLPEFDQALTGMKAHEEKEIKVLFPQDYHHKELAETLVDFHIKLISVKEKQLPEINDEFIKSLGDESMTLNEFKARIREDIELSESERIKSELRKQVSDLLVELNEVEAPRSLVEEQKAMIFEQMGRDARAQRFSEKDIEAFKKERDGEISKSAEDKVKLDFLVMDIAKKYNLVPTKEEIDMTLVTVKNMADMSNRGKKKGRSSDSAWMDTPEYRDYLTHQLMENKVLDFVIKKAAQ